MIPIRTIKTKEELVMRRTSGFTLRVIRIGKVIFAFTLATLAVQAQAQLTNRAGKWEATLQLNYSDSTDIQGSTGSQATIDSEYGFGLGFAKNLNDHLALGVDFAWSQPDYIATVTPAAGNGNSAYTVSGTLETYSTHVVATWNLLAQPLTPFVSGGVGGTWVDTNIPAGPPVNVCWYDPWWGYYCGPVYPTRSDTYFSYNAAVGLRWDSREKWFLRGLVGKQWLDVGGDVGTPSITNYRFDLGFRF
ncbi:MAG: outer membrane beta-barrel protein [Burkholderiales bacterium]